MAYSHCSLFTLQVVDSEDVPLNISRESMQDSALMRKLSSVLSRRVLKFLQERGDVGRDTGRSGETCPLAPRAISRPADSSRAGQLSPHISPHLPTSPQISPDLEAPVLESYLKEARLWSGGRRRTCGRSRACATSSSARGRRGGAAEGRSR